MKFLKEFKAFAFKGNVIDLAVAVIIGAAFGKIITSLVNDIFMPVIGLIIGKVNFDNLFWAVDGNKYETAAKAAEAGVGVVNYGVFLKNTVDFVLIALIVFLFIKFLLSFRTEEPEPEAPRVCPYCKKEIEKGAVRCPYCTSDI